MTLKLNGALPSGDKNGLGRITAQLVDQPEDVHVAIVLLDTARLTTNVDDDSVTPTVRIRAIEPIPAGHDASELRRLLRRAFEQRTGLVELPLDLERALEGIAVGEATSEEDTEDPLDLQQLKDAVEVVVHAGYVDDALLPQRLEVSPERAAELLSLMQAQGVIGLPEPDESPTVLVGVEDLATTLDGLRLYAGRTSDEIPGEPGMVPDTIPMAWTGGPTFLDGSQAPDTDTVPKEPGDAPAVDDDRGWDYPASEGTPTDTDDDSETGTDDEPSHPGDDA